MGQKNDWDVGIGTVTNLGTAEATALRELAEWWEDLADRSIGARGLLVSVPHGWGRTTIMERFAELVENDQDRVGIVLRIRGAEAPSGAGLQVSWLFELVDKAGLSERWRRVLGVDRPAGVFGLSADLAGFGLLSAAGQVAAFIVGLGLRKLAADRDDSDAGPPAMAARLGRTLARQCVRVPLVVLVDDADELDAPTMERFIDGVVSRWDGQALLVVVADPDSDIAHRLNQLGRDGPIQNRILPIETSADMGETMRRQLVESQDCGWPVAATERLVERTESFKDIWRVLAARGAADVVFAPEPASQHSAVDKLVDEVLDRGRPTLAAATVAWTGGIMHRAQLDAALAQLASAPKENEKRPPDRWIVGFGPFVRLADPGSIERATRSAESLLSVADRKEVVSKVVDTAVALTSTHAGGGPIDRVALVTALRPVYHLAETGVLSVDVAVGSLLLNLVDQFEALGEVGAAYGCARTTLDCLVPDSSPEYDIIRTRLIAVHRRLRAYLPGDASDNGAETEARAEIRDAALGIEARIWAAITLLNQHATRDVGLTAANGLAEELDSRGSELGIAGARWRLLLAFHVGQAGQPNTAERLLRPILDYTNTDELTREVATQILVAISGPRADLHLGRSLLGSEYERFADDAEPDERLRVVAALADLNDRLGDYRCALKWGREELAIRTILQNPHHRDVFATRANIGNWTGKTGDAASALKLFQQLLREQIRAHGADDPAVLANRANAALWTGVAGDAALARTLFVQLLPDQIRIVGPENQMVLATRSNIARWTGDAGDAREALRLFGLLLPDQVRLLGADHLDVLAARSTSAVFAGRAVNAREGLTLLDDLIPDQIRALGPDHPDVLISRSNIANFTDEAGDPAGALNLFTELLNDQVRVLGADHPDVFATRSNIGICTGRAGDTTGAVRLFTELVDDQIRALDSDHPNVLATRSKIAYWTGQMGDAGGALNLFTELLPDQLRVFGPDDSRVLTTRASIAHFTNVLGNPGGALNLFTELLNDQVRVLGADHPDVFATRSNIGICTGRAGDTTGAVRLLTELVDDQIRALDPDHPNVLATRSKIAYWTGQMGDAGGALNLFTELLPDQLRVFGPDDSRVLTTRASIAHFTNVLGNPGGALNLFTELLNDQVRVLGADHPDVFATRSNIGICTGRAGDTTGAVRLLTELVDDQIRALGPDHPNVFATRSKIAYWTGQMGDAGGALNLFTELLPDQLRVFGPDDSRVLTTRASIAHFTNVLGNPGGALNLFTELLNDQVRVLGADHPDVFATRSNIGICTGRAGDTTGAVRLFTELVDDQIRALGPDHPNVLATRSKIAYWTGKVSGLGSP